ncbi:serine hydrolase domain-containing protein [Novosphingobium aquimarinum]|uniref:serine hydrolase domain-containing protein n=1 Tax=Novosphingobium aquimarinum TaxID=2682494 RepID=UPI0018DCF436|nr:serine hydrolase domain-containing protein [Novosphingobium aquimarinum]
MLLPTSTVLAAALLAASSASPAAASPPAIETPASNPTYPAVEMPDTPAGRFERTWLEAYNSADRAQLERYNALYDRKAPPEDWIAMHATTGTLTPVKVTSDGPNEILVLFAPEKGDAFWSSKISIDPDNPMQLLEKPGNGLTTANRPPEFALPRFPQAQLNAMADRKIAADVAADRFAGTVLVVRHGEVVYQTAAGLADRESEAPVTINTKFRLGSANKMFTAVSVLQRVAKGDISLDATVGDYLPDYPNKEFARSVTIRQLLSHTGGAGDIFTEEYEKARLQTRTLADYVTLFGDRAPDTSEAGKGAYANYGFVLLGRIVEVVSGETYYDYVRRHIFAPAGMRDTGSLPEETPVPNRSKGYVQQDGALRDNANTLPWRGSSAGGGYSTAGDMVRFMAALRAGRLIPADLLAEATSPQRPDGWYGFGFIVAGEGLTRNWGHGGGAPGMNSSIRVYPELDAIVVALANLDPPAAEDEADFYANRMLPGE